METIILFAPLLGAIIGGFGWRVIGEKGAMALTTGLLFLACALSWVVFLGHDGQTHHIEILKWIQSGVLDTSWGIRVDRLTAIMLIVVTTVSALVHLYSWGYMAHDDNWGHHEHYKARFFAYLSFFTFTMLSLVTADNLVQMFFGWEGVGVVVMMLDIDFAELKGELARFMPLGLLVGVVMLLQLGAAFGAWQTAEGADNLHVAPMVEGVDNTTALGLVLYDQYLFLFQAAGLILLVAMIGAILLTLRHRKDVKRQNVIAQMHRDPAKALELVDVKPGQGL